MALTRPIDGNKFDIRVICTGPGDSEDSGYVEGVPIDPPDDKPGWMLVDLWVEHDTEQETIKADKDKGERGRTVTRLVNPAFFQMWVKPKSARKKARKAKPAVTLVADPLPAAPDAKTSEPKKKRGRQKKTKPAEGTPTNGDGGEAPGVQADALEEFSRCCEHTRQMLVATVNVGDRREIALEDVRTYAPLCNDCSRAKKSEATA